MFLVCKLEPFLCDLCMLFISVFPQGCIVFLPQPKHMKVWWIGNLKLLEGVNIMLDLFRLYNGFCRVSRCSSSRKKYSLKMDRWTEWEYRTEHEAVERWYLVGLVLCVICMFMKLNNRYIQAKRTDIRSAKKEVKQNDLYIIKGLWCTLQ